MPGEEEGAPSPATVDVAPPSDDMAEAGSRRAVGGTDVAKLAFVEASVHSFLLLVILPLFYFAVSGISGAILASLEGWEVVDGILYVGGNLVLVPLTDVLPTSTSGTAVDIVVSMFSFGALGWGLTIVGLLPFCEAVRSSLHAATKFMHKNRRPNLASFVTATLFLVIVWPLLCVLLSAVVGGCLMRAEGWTFGDSFGRALEVLSHTPSLAPTVGRPVSLAGKLLILLIAFQGVSFTLGVTVGVCVILPAFDLWVGFLSKVTVIKGDHFLAISGNFCVVVLTIVPLMVLPWCMVAGVALNTVEGWGSVTKGMLYVAGNMVSIPLSTEVPASTSGKAIDVMVSCIGVGCFGFLIAILGGLAFTDKCCEFFGGKVDGHLPAIRFTLIFYLFVMPVICVVVAVPLGGLLSAIESLAFGDGWLYVMSVLAQAPSLSPPGLTIQSDGGRVMVFLTACYSLCVTIGWGAGLVAASKALDNVGDAISATIARLKAAVQIEDKVGDDGQAVADGPAADAVATPPATASENQADESTL